jgi:archaellum component FlaC
MDTNLQAELATANQTIASLTDTVDRLSSQVSYMSPKISVFTSQVHQAGIYIGYLQQVLIDNGLEHRLDMSSQPDYEYE